MEYMLQGTNNLRFSSGEYAGVELFGDSNVLKMIRAKKIVHHIDNGTYCRYRIEFHKPPQIAMEGEEAPLPVAIVYTVVVATPEAAREVGDALVKALWHTKLKVINPDGTTSSHWLDAA